MAEAGKGPTGPDFAQGIAEDDVGENAMLGGHVGDEAVLIARVDGELHAIGAKCTHYGGPLAEGLLVGAEVHCPWHHACFSLKTGEAVHAPAFDPVSRWRVETRDGKLFVREKLDPVTKTPPPADQPERIVIVGGGAAGFACAEMLRRRGFTGSLTMLSADESPPVDRPNLSKDFLAGTAPEDWMPLRDLAWYRGRGIDLRLNTPVAAIETDPRRVLLAGGETLPYDRLLLATGAEPRKLDVPGSTLPHVFTLRSFADCRAIIAAAAKARSAVVVGASFIGLEAAASLRTRGLSVTVVAPEAVPMANIFGAEIGAFVRSLHEEHGVVFRLEDLVSAIESNEVVTKAGAHMTADLVVVGIGVTPRTALAAHAGLEVDDGVVVDEFLEAGVPGVFAAGDIARFPYRPAAGLIRVEHWVVAERQGQCAARNMLGDRQPFDDIPFFWSQHYDVPINYVGNARRWDRLVVDGDIAKRDCLVRYIVKDKEMAAATVYRDKASLEAERDIGEGGG